MYLIGGFANTKRTFKKAQWTKKKVRKSKLIAWLFFYEIKYLIATILDPQKFKVIPDIMVKKPIWSNILSNMGHQ